MSRRRKPKAWSAAPRRPPGRGEEAASPVVGTLLILGITGIAIPGALMAGLPLVEDARADAAAHRMVTQLEAARDAAASLTVAGAAVEVPFQVPAGTLGIRPGTTAVVTVGMDDDPLYAGCDRKPSGFTDGDRWIGMAAAPGTTCRPVGPSNACPQVLGIKSATACVEVTRFDADGATAVGVSTALAPLLRLQEPLDPRSQYRVTFWREDGAGREVLGRTWILPSDRVEWSMDGATVAQELGGLLLQDGGAPAVTAMPRLAEEAGPDGAFLLRVPTLHGNGGTGGAQAALVAMRTARSQALEPASDALRLRLDLAGSDARAWCQAFLARNGAEGLPSGPAGRQYREDPAAPCSGGAASAPGASLTYGTAAPGPGDAFPVTVSHAWIDASLRR